MIGPLIDTSGELLSLVTTAPAVCSFLPLVLIGGTSEESKRVAVEAQNRLLNLNRKIIATAASRNQYAATSSMQEGLCVGMEAFSWDQASPYPATVCAG